jgi:hypothetical protein
MSWVGGECQGDREWKCYYLTWDTGEDVCLDYDGSCPQAYDRAGLVRQERS